MKKGLSRFLSIMCSIAALSSMLSINSTSAIELTRGEVKEEISTAVRHCHEQLDMSILNTEYKIDIEKFANVVIYKLINFIKTHLGERSEDFIEQLISRMNGRKLYERVTNRKLSFICTLAETLKEIVDERSFVSSEDVHKQLIFFYDNILSTSIILECFSTKADISEHVKNVCVIEIIRTIKEMSGSLNVINHKYMRLLRFMVLFDESPRLDWVIDHTISDYWKRDLAKQNTQLT